MKRTLIFKNKALKDLEEIEEYTFENWGISQAKIYIKGIINTCNRIADGKSIGLSCNLKGNYLKYVFKAHVIYFQEDSNYLKIIRILHGAMDAERYLR